MKTEREKMLAGELYNALDPALVEERARCHALCASYNTTSDLGSSERRELLREILGRKSDACIQPPFFCDYGTNIRLGEGVYFNFNCVVPDVVEVTISDRSLFGPAV